MRTVSRKTVAAYISAASHQMGKALEAASHNFDLSDKEITDILRAKRLLRELASRTNTGTK